MPDAVFRAFPYFLVGRPGNPLRSRASGTGPGFRQPRNNLRRLAVIAVVPALALGAASAEPLGAGEPSVAALRICTHDPFPSRVADFRYVILNAWDWRRVAAIKKRSPA